MTRDAATAREAAVRTSWDRRALDRIIAAYEDTMLEHDVGYEDFVDVVVGVRYDLNRRDVGARAGWTCDWEPDDLNPGPDCPYCAGEMCARFDGLGCTHDRIERHGYQLSAPSTESRTDGGLT